MDSLSLSELSQQIKKSLEENLEESYWVIAEISELKINQRGHCYLELVEKENDLIKAKTKATVWSYTFRNLSGWFESITGESLKPGMKILSNVTVNFHEVYGLSLNIRDIDPQYTLGERAIQRQEIIKRLNEEGIINMNRELDLPTVPQRIALIASPTSAGYQDFMEQLRYNQYQYKFIIKSFDTLMQGNEAEASIIKALLDINEEIDNYDLVAIVRGGGAALDLECFDAFNLSSHIAQFPIPVITGIGHEKDETIVDLVAHSKLKTPTAVAEFLISGMRRYDEQIEEHFIRISETAQNLIKEHANHLDGLTNEIKYLLNASIDQRRNKMLLLEQKLNYSSISRIDELKLKVNASMDAIRNLVPGIIKFENSILDNQLHQLQLMDPANILKRGYSITRSGGKLIKEWDKLEKDTIIETEIKKGKFKSKLI